MGLFSKLFGKSGTASEKSTLATSPQMSVSINSIDPETPDFQGDYAKTIFLWALSRASEIKKDSEYVGYLLYECGIKRPSAYHRQMIDEGYLRESTNADMLAALKVTELKELLSSVGASTTGKKDMLVQRALDCVDNETLNRRFSTRTYSISEKGTAFLSEHDDYVQLHRHKNWGVSWQEYNQNHRPGHSFNDTMWGILNARVLQDNRSFGRNEYVCMYQLLHEEGRRSDALQMLLKILYIDFSGVEGMDTYKLYKEKIYSLKEAEEAFSICVMFAPGIINPVAEYKDIFDDSYIDRVYEQKLPVQLCSKELFASMIHSVIDGSYNEEKVSAKLFAAYKQFLRKI